MAPVPKSLQKKEPSKKEPTPEQTLRQINAWYAHTASEDPSEGQKSDKQLATERLADDLRQRRLRIIADYMKEKGYTSFDSFTEDDIKELDKRTAKITAKNYADVLIDLGKGRGFKITDEVRKDATDLERNTAPSNQFLIEEGKKSEVARRQHNAMENVLEQLVGGQLGGMAKPPPQPGKPGKGME